MICSTIFCTFVVLCLLADYSDSKLLRLFSVRHNLSKIYKIPEDHQSNEYAFLHGFKAIYVALSAIAHACAILYLFCPSMYASARSFRDSNTLFAGMVKRSLLGPDIAAFMAGFLAIVVWFAVFSQKRANFFIYIFARFLRTVPILIAILLFDRVWPRFGTGPFFRQMTTQLWSNCDRSFWKLFLFISNRDRVVDLVSFLFFRFRISDNL